jgi:hypothetical protein
MSNEFDHAAHQAEEERLGTTLQHYWAERLDRSLRRARNRAAAEQLLKEIFRWSSRQKKRFGPNAGGWVTHMEYGIWNTQPKLRAMAQEAGGWFAWIDGEVFVPMLKWRNLRRIYETMITAQDLANRSRHQFDRLTLSCDTSRYYAWAERKRGKAR